MRALITLLPGDGIGPEVMSQSRRVLEEVAALGRHSFDLKEAVFGGSAIDATGSPLPDQTLSLCRRSDAVLLVAVGGPKWDDPKAQVRPEQGLLKLRKELGLFANLRPVLPHPKLIGASSLKPEVVRGVDLLVVRELTGGIYFGEKRREGERATDTCVYSVDEVTRIVRTAATLARSRRKKLTSVDKANVLETSRLWREVADRVVRKEFQDVRLEHMLVDASAMHLIRRPADFDVIVTENMFGDILTDEASMLAGSIGMLPSASLGEARLGLYEPIHGSAPDIAGKGTANPYGTILSAAMLLRHSLGLIREARALESAVSEAIDGGALTPDLGGIATTAEATEAVLAALRLP